MATGATGAPPDRTVMSMARVSARPKSPLSGCNLITESATAANCSAATFRRLVSPPARADQVSAAAAMRLRAKTMSAGSKRPNCSVSYSTGLVRARPYVARTACSARASSSESGTLSEQKNTRSCASRSEILWSPRASDAYWRSTREAARLVYTSTGHNPIARPSKNAALTIQNVFGSRTVCAAAKPAHSSLRRRADLGSPVRMTLRTAWSI